MVFLIQYDRSPGKVVRLDTYADSDLARAEEERLAIELELNRQGVNHEVLLLDAASEEALRMTHQRYFEGELQKLASTLANTKQ